MHDHDVTDDDILKTRLRAWAKTKDNRVRAAVELLIEHDHWLWNPGFIDACMFLDDGLPGIRFGAVAGYHDSGPAGSGGQLAVLRVAADIGSGRWGLDVMDIENRYLVQAAVTQAAGLAGGPR